MSVVLLCKRENSSKIYTFTTPAEFCTNFDAILTNLKQQFTDTALSAGVLGVGKGEICDSFKHLLAIVSAKSSIEGWQNNNAGVTPAILDLWMDNIGHSIWRNRGV